METQCVPCKQNIFTPKGPSNSWRHSCISDAWWCLSFWSVQILQLLAKQSIELSNDISIIPCNVLDILPSYVYTSTMPFKHKFRNKFINCFYGNYSSILGQVITHPSELWNAALSCINCLYCFWWGSCATSIRIVVDALNCIFIQ